jgi:structure-specific endonuclease subunit SLX1
MTNSGNSCCYLLSICNGRQTYVGATVDVERRLRQHNQELVGGARATGMRVAEGNVWERICYITGIPEWRSALQIEWRWKQLGRTRYKYVTHPIQRRLMALKYLLMLEKPTEKSIPYEAYPSGPPTVVWDQEEWKQWYDRTIIVSDG